MYDIAVIGAGPAGSDLARMIGKKYKVLLIDKRQLAALPENSSVIKCCGGLLAPDAQKITARLGLALPQGVITGPQIFAVRTLDFDNGLERFYQRFYINLDREKFDRWLVSLIPSLVDMRWGCHFKSFEKEGDRFKIYFSRDGRTDFAYARMLIGADGAGSPVRRQALPDHPLPKSYIAIQEWFTTREALPHTSRPSLTGKSATFMPGPYLKKII